MGIALVLFSAALINLLTKEVATISGLAFTAAFFSAFVVSERLTARRRAAVDSSLDQFQLTAEPEVGIETLHCQPHNLLVAVRDYNTLSHLEWVVSQPETENRDIIVVTLRLLRGPDGGALQLGQDELFTDYEQRLFTRVVAVAERHGRTVKLLVAPATNIFDAVVHAAIQLRSDQIIMRESANLPSAQQALLVGEAWDRAPHDRDITASLIVRGMDGTIRRFSLGAHAPELSPAQVEHIHKLWVEAVRTVGPKIHHRDIVAAALGSLEDELAGERRAEAVERLRRHIES
jgi:hypothetical protein